MPHCPRCEALMDAIEIVCPQCGHRLKEEVVYQAGYDPPELLALGLSPKLVEFVFADPKPEGFEFWCESRHAGWACFIPPNVRGVYPLWCCGSNVTALWMRGGRLEFVKLYHDDPEPRLLARTEQGMLAHLFVQLVESADWHRPEEDLGRLRAMAERVGFRQLDTLYELYERESGASDFGKRLDRLLESLDTR